MKKFIEHILQSLIHSSNDSVIFENNSDDTYKLTVYVPREELGKVIGKNGQMANAIRTIASFHAQKVLNKKLAFSITEKNASS